MKFGFVGISVIFLFYLIPFQDLVVSYLFIKGFPFLFLKAILVLKEVIVLLFGFFLLIKRRISKARVFLIVFLGYSLISVCFSEINSYSTLLGLRTYLLLLFSFVLGEQLKTFSFFLSSFYRHISIVFILIFVFSFLEYWVLPMTIWKDPFPIMEMKRQVANLNTPNEYYDFGYPVNAFGEITRRMLGPFDEPLYMAYFTIILVNFFMVRVLYDKGRAKFGAIFGTVMVLLTQTRAIILGFFLSLALLLTNGTRIRKKYIVIGTAAIVLLIPIVFAFSEEVVVFVYSIFDSKGRNIGHLQAYSTGAQLLLTHPFGSGIGSASSLVGFSESNNATENAFINIGLEIGLIGMVFFFLFFICLIFQFRGFIKRRSSSGASYQVVSAGYLLAIQFVFSGLVAPHILTARILIPFMIIMGWAYSISTEMEGNENSNNNSYNNG